MDPLPGAPAAVEILGLFFSFSFRLVLSVSGLLHLHLHRLSRYFYLCPAAVHHLVSSVGVVLSLLSHHSYFFPLGQKIMESKSTVQYFSNSEVRKKGNPKGLHECMHIRYSTYVLY